MVKLSKEAQLIQVLVLIWFLVSIMFVCYAIPRSFGFSPITIDGVKSDWFGVVPIVNDTGDRSFWADDAGDFRVLRGYDITECYVLADQDWLYFLFSKRPGGSAIWQLYFDTDLDDQTGFSINGMGADFRFSKGTGEKMTKWINSQWVGLNLTEGSVVDAFGSSWDISWIQSIEWLEGKISFGVLDNSTVFRMVFQVLPEQDAAPETGYIVVSVNEGLRFAASFTSSSTILAYGQRTETDFLLFNYDSTEIEVSGLDIEMPPTIGWISGETHWSGRVSASRELALSSTVEPLVYGWSTLYSVFNVADSSGNKITNLSIPLSIIMAPTISLAVVSPKNVTLGYDNFMNVTVVNHDPLTAPVNIEHEPWSNILFEKVSLKLSSLASVQLYIKITPINVNLKQPSRIDPQPPHMQTAISLKNVQASGEVKATFENIVLDKKGIGLNVIGPEMRIALITMRTIPGNQTHRAYITIENLENTSISLTVSLFLEPQDIVSIRDENQKDVTILPGNNATVSFQIKTLEATDFWGKFSITVYGNIIDEVFVQSVNVGQPLSPVVYGLAATFLVLLGVVLVFKRKWIADKLSPRSSHLQRF